MVKGERETLKNDDEEKEKEREKMHRGARSVKPFVPLFHATRMERAPGAEAACIECHCDQTNNAQ